MIEILLRHQYLNPADREKILNEILCYKPIWENRFSKSNPPPTGQPNRQLLRPVYWLGNWQFACLNYYHPPKGVTFRCVQAEPYGPYLKGFVKEVEKIVRQKFHPKNIPHDWHLNTCLINYYGSKIENGKKIDAARVGEHKDFEPGPVASLSFGEKALFQFVHSRRKDVRSQVVLQQWLADSSLQIFGGNKYKDLYFHRVQRVEKNKSEPLPAFKIPDFEMRRINLTFRYVPREHIQRLQEFPSKLKEDINPYVKTLSESSIYWKQQLDTI
ncbi:MAG: alpha-ketoglutarate-dependent dioxygenase AlkB [Bdellovibrionales bacterium]